MNPTDYELMPLAELQTAIDAEILEITVQDILSIAPEKRAAAIADFSEADPELAQRLSIAVSFALS